MTDVERKEILAKEVATNIIINYGSDKYILERIISNLEEAL